MPSLPFAAPTATLPTQTPTLTPEPTLTETPLPTATATLTLTPSPTIFRTPTETPINFALAETGFDIADVRYSYPREDMLVIDFKYRLDERLESYTTLITVEIPRRCSDNTFSGFFIDDKEPESRTVGLYFLTRLLQGEGQIVFKMTIEGACSADGLEFSISPFNYPIWPLPDDLSYKEYVPQRFEVRRTFPTMNSDAVSARNFRFEPGDNWTGTFTFDYQISEQIPIPPEEYHFEISEWYRNDNCALSGIGPQIASHSGTYSIEVDLLRDNPQEFSQCQLPTTNLTFSNTRLSLKDELALTTVYYRELDFSYIVWKDW